MVNEIQIGVDRPAEVALISAIKKSISDIAVDQMTTVEVVGVLQQVSHELLHEHLYGEIDG